MEFLYGHDEEVSRFIETFDKSVLSGYGPRKTIGIVDDDGRLIAGLVYFNYNPHAAVMEFGAVSTDKRWLNRRTYRRMFEYPFIECACQMLVARIRADNEPLLSVVARMNFNLTYIPRMYGYDEDGVYCTLTDDQWLDSAVAKRIYRDANKRKEAA